MIHCYAYKKHKKSQMLYDLNKFNFNFWELYHSKFDFLICLSDRSQCLESHGIVDFAYKLQLHYNIYILIFPIWTENIIKMKIPLGSKLYAKRNIP